jgi:hypothetical protein
LEERLGMARDYIFRGRRFSDGEVELIREVCEKHRDDSRRKISMVVCELINWRQPNERLKDRACRDVLLRMNERGLIALPPKRCESSKKPRSATLRLEVDFREPEEEITEIDSIDLKMIRGTKDEKLWNWLIDRYHYLGYRTPVGHFLKYLIYDRETILGCIGFADAVLKLNLRDKWIGWSVEEREKNLHLVINNVRFLILRWVRVRNLASMILSRASKRVQEDWELFYGYRPVLLETFIDAGRFIGTSYKASNWHCLGRTEGKGRRGMKYFVHNQPKDLYVYPLCKNALKILRGEK